MPNDGRDQCPNTAATTDANYDGSHGRRPDADGHSYGDSDGDGDGDSDGNGDHDAADDRDADPDGDAHAAGPRDRQRDALERLQGVPF